LDQLKKSFFKEFLLEKIGRSNKIYYERRGKIQVIVAVKIKIRIIKKASNVLKHLEAFGLRRKFMVLSAHFLLLSIYNW
jgi:hypothetical protein